MQSFLIYGASGYTGRMIVAEAVRQGLQPIIAGRNGEAIQQLAEQYGLQSFVFGLDDETQLRKALEQVPLVLNCAGPFSQTWRYFRDACLRYRKHYLDITGELSVFEGFAQADNEARQAGIMFLPGMGFDVVPTDCLAAALKEKMPDAVRIRMALSFFKGGFSRGTLKSITDMLGEKGKKLEGGKLTTFSIGSLTRAFDFGRGERTCVALPLADVFTAGYSTGVASVEMYAQLPRPMIRMMRLGSFFSALLRTAFVRQLVKRRISRLPEGPDTDSLKNGRSLVMGEAENASGKKIRLRMEAPQGYALTVQSAVAGVKNVLQGQFKPGFQTPSLAFGKDFAGQSAGCKTETV